MDLIPRFSNPLSDEPGLLEPDLGERGVVLFVTWIVFPGWIHKIFPIPMSNDINVVVLNVLAHEAKKKKIFLRLTD